MVKSAPISSEKADKTAGKKPPAPAAQHSTRQQEGFLLQNLQRGVLPANLRPADILQLQRSVGNRAVGALLRGITPVRSVIQAKSADNKPTNQYKQEGENHQSEPASLKPNNTGLPDKLKSGIEALSGISMDNIRVHYNSPKPEQINALAYAQGTDIHLATGQEQHLPHEAWHVVQQAQGRVMPTIEAMYGVEINDDMGLEHEADVMGRQALNSGFQNIDRDTQQIQSWLSAPIVQARFVHFNAHPPGQNSDATWVVKSVQVAGERPPWRPETLTAIDSRQASLAGEANLAIRHINAWDRMISDLVGLANNVNTIQNVADLLNGHWPATSTVTNPGVPNPLDDESLSNYAEFWLDARHNDPANLFWGNKAENSGFGNRYDNPTKAKGLTRGAAGSAFNQEEKQKLVTEQIKGCGVVIYNGEIDSDFWRKGQQFGDWILSYYSALEQTNKDQLDKFRGRNVKLADIVKFLSNNKVFTKIELTKIFRRPSNLTGPL